MSSSSSSSSSLSSSSSENTIKVGERFSMIRYCTVTEDNGDAYTVETDDGSYWQVDKAIIARSCHTAGTYTREYALTQTQLATKFEKIGDVIFTVKFEKKVKFEDVADAIGALEEDPRPLPLYKRRRLAKDLLRGEDRVLIGHMLSPEPDPFGRMRVRDLEVPAAANAHSERLVDPRTIEWLIYKDVKYTKKK